MTEPAATSPKPADGTPAVESPPLAPNSVALCYVVDGEPSIRHFLSLVLHGAGVDTVEFADGASMRKALESQAPALVFINISLESADAIETVVALGKGRYRGAVQLMSARGAAVLEHVKGIGAQHKLQMLPDPLRPKRSSSSYRSSSLAPRPRSLPSWSSTTPSRTSGSSSGTSPRLHCVKSNWRAPRLTRAFVPPAWGGLAGAFTANASEPATAKLSELALENALKTSAHFSKLGVNLRLSVNIPVPALMKISVEDIVKAHRPASEKWPGLIIDCPKSKSSKISSSPTK